MKFLLQKWRDCPIRVKVLLPMVVLLLALWALVFLEIAQLSSFSAHSQAILGEYSDTTGFIDAFSAENACLDTLMRPTEYQSTAREDYLAAIEKTDRCLA